MFKLNSDSQFSDRSQSVFGSIDDIAKANNKLSKDNKKDTSSDNFNEDKKKTTQDFKGRESIFRSPNESGWPPSSRHRDRRNDDSRRHRQDRHRHRPRHPRKVPDHIVNPDKYTKYDLSDISKDQMSDRSNTRAAFDFLAEMKDRNTCKSDDSSKDQNSGSNKVTFKKPVRKIQSTSTASSSNVVKDGVKRVMPECVVGQKRSKDQVKKNVHHSNKKVKCGQISLSHLDDNEESD